MKKGNGIKNRPEREVLKLSDMFEMPTDDPQLELKALLLNINEGFNEDLKEACKTLGDYTEYTGRVRKYAKEMSIEDAVEQAITECIAEGILAEFLSRNRAEAKKVSIYEYDEEKHMRMEREESRENGIAIGIVKTAQKYHAEKEQIINQISDELNVSHQEAETIYSEVEEYIKTSQEEK